MYCFNITRSNYFPEGKVSFNREGMMLPSNKVYIRGVTIKDDKNSVPYTFIDNVFSVSTAEAGFIKQATFAGVGAVIGGFFGFAMGLLASNRNPKVTFKVVLSDGRSFIAEAKEKVFEALYKYYAVRY